MATSVGVANNVQIFDCTLYIAGAEQGYLGESAEFSAPFERKDFKAGIPKTLRKSTKVEEDATLKVEMVEMTAENIKRALSIDTSLSSTSVVCGGGDSVIPELTDVVLKGIDDQDKAIYVRFFRARVVDIGPITFDADYCKLNITFAAIHDLTRSKGAQLYEISREA